MNRRVSRLSGFYAGGAGRIEQTRLFRDQGSVGFTLLEVCVVLFIVAVLAAVAGPPTARLFQEEQLRRPVRELQSFAKEGRRSALAENRSYRLVLLNDGFVLQPADRKGDSDRPDESYRLPGDVKFAIKRINDTDFKKNVDARWIFLPNGLCEPLTFLFQRGQDWIKFRIDPLTARIENQESYIP
jgi:prepilin-type N-terminal cleavage/methylation domain-containing protein